MALPVGQISLSQVNTELSFTSTATISLNDAAVRNLAAVPSGQIGMNNLQGKSAVFITTITSNQTNLDLFTLAQSLGYSSGAAQITIGSGVYVIASSTVESAARVPASFGAGNLTLINNGFILGKGGAGGVAPSVNVPGAFVFAGFPGGQGLSMSTPMTLTNNGYVAGGGGGGGSSNNFGQCATGGGGAGGGPGGNLTGSISGGAGSTIGGNAGSQGNKNTPTGGLNTGGGGGLILPGTGGASVLATGDTTQSNQLGNGGGSGASGAAERRVIPPNAAVPFFRTLYGGGGGGGGYGASGGTSNNSSGAAIGLFTMTSGSGGNANGAGGAANSGSGIAGITGSGGSGGAAIARNGNTLTQPAAGTIYGPIS